MRWQEQAWIIHCTVVGPEHKGIGAGSETDRRFLTLALAGEVGELANIVKKTWRGDFTAQDAMADIREEMADIRIYLEILGRAYGVDLDEVCEEKMPELLRRWPEAQDAMTAKLRKEIGR